ncbi:bacteriocin maturation protein [Cohnella silvisoli]|uniref:Bacteriocin maturation protein n=1 Tax=Cohnella silvisoli TaxID=2873699 RepID=A0ABV1L159_9BACL|nr:bacteriocin maturation protein [Cohnella silvisoli]MCD9025251.1 bacteriocin maturation protein [Cohnella silvisoli]
MANVPDNIVERYDLQIKFLDSCGKLGVSLFQSYKESKVLAVGAGSFLVSLVAALFESGLSKVHVIITDSEPTDRRLLLSLAENAKNADPKAELQHSVMSERTVSAWKEGIQPFDWILYMSKQTKLEEIQAIHTACIAEKKSLLIAMCHGQTGFAGPLVSPDSEGCWESAWRRVHHSAIRNDPMIPIFRSAAAPMLANIIVFDMFRTITRAAKPELENKFFMLDLHTLEGSYHSFLPHPLITKGITTEQVQNLDQLLVSGRGSNSDPNKFLSFINRLTSPQSGILHLWDEGDLKQLPLAQCRVQAVDPLSEGPAELLPVIIRAGLTHIEARKEAGLAGIEAYLTRISHLLGTQFHEIGAGETVEEAVYRGLQKCLTQQLRKQTAYRKPTVQGVQISHVEDTRCRYYLQALTTMQGTPTIGLGDDVLGFPVVWIGNGDCWYGCVGLNRTLALRITLEQALLKAQNRTAIVTLQGVEIPSLDPEEAILTNLEIKAVEDTAHAEWIQYALPVLKRNQTRLIVLEMMAEPLLNEHLGGLFCVMLGKEEASR